MCYVTLGSNPGRRQEAIRLECMRGTFSDRIRLPSLATAARTKRSQIIIRVNSRAVTVIPPELESVVADRADLF